MEHDIIRKYADIRIKISGWDERIQQYPHDCPRSTVGEAAYRTFGYTTKHFIPRTSAQEIGNATCMSHPVQRRHTIIRPEVMVCPYITTYQRHYCRETCNVGHSSLIHRKSVFDLN